MGCLTSSAPPPAHDHLCSTAGTRRRRIRFLLKENSLRLSAFAVRHGKIQPRNAITSTSIFASLGRRAAWIVDLAGWGGVKKVA
jgi:hypothetical protein